MARRSQKLNLQGFGIAVALGAPIIIAVKVSQTVAPGPESAITGLIVGVALVVAAIVIAFLVIRHQKARVRRSLFDKAQKATDHQLTSLVRRRAQLVQPDP